MKRAEALQPLSHQHHNSLMACLLLKKGIARKASQSTLNDFLSKFFREDIEPHFEAEEKHLLPLLDQLKPSYGKILRSDHTLLRVLAARFMNHFASFSYLSNFATLLENHIRFEERLVFNFVQEHLNPTAEAELGKKLSVLGAKRCTDYPVKFWE
jgi:hemerythrin-like domain-containing protein